MSPLLNENLSIQVFGHDPPDHTRSESESSSVSVSTPVSVSSPASVTPPVSVSSPASLVTQATNPPSTNTESKQTPETLASITTPTAPTTPAPEPPLSMIFVGVGFGSAFGLLVFVLFRKRRDQSPHDDTDTIVQRGAPADPLPPKAQNTELVHLSITSMSPSTVVNNGGKKRAAKVTNGEKEREREPEKL